MRDDWVPEAISRITSAAAPDMMQGIDQSINSFDRLVPAIITRLERDASVRPFAAERLAQLGALVLSHVQAAFAKTNDQESRLYLAGVLLALGDRAGVPDLLDAVRVIGPHTCQAATWLARASVEEAAPAIAQAVRVVVSGDVDHVVCLVKALRALGSELPSDAAERFGAESSPWQVRTLVDDQSC